MGRYRPTSPEEIPKFAGVRTFMRMPHVRTLEDVNFVVVGIPFDDATTFRSGARFGPEGIRSISAMIRPWHPVHDIDVFQHLSGVDYGDVAVVPGDVEATCEKTARDFQAIAAAGVTSFAMGSDHSVTLGELRGLCAVHGPLALVHFYAHVDTSEGNYGRKYDHGTPFRRAAEEKLVETSRSIQIGIRGGRAGPEYYQQSRDMGYEGLGRAGHVPFGKQVSFRPEFRQQTLERHPPDFRKARHGAGDRGQGAVGVESQRTDRFGPVDSEPPSADRSRGDRESQRASFQ